MRKLHERVKDVLRDPNVECDPGRQPNRLSWKALPEFRQGHCQSSSTPLVTGRLLAIGEEAVGCAECLRLARLGKAIGAKVVAGGCFFGHVAPQVLRTGLVDVVAHGEGENTIVELTDALLEGTTDALERVAGISFLRDGRPFRTSTRPLIHDLDDLPMPAWDLLPMHRYAAGSRNHPGLAAIELSRGCVDACGFCVLWRQMGKFVGDQTRPHVRTKSVQRLMDEVRVQTPLARLAKKEQQRLKPEDLALYFVDLSTADRRITKVPIPALPVPAATQTK